MKSVPLNTKSIRQETRTQLEHEVCLVNTKGALDNMKPLPDTKSVPKNAKSVPRNIRLSRERFLKALLALRKTLAPTSAA
jgi:hypothetical protein